MNDNPYACVDRWGYEYPEHDYDAGDVEGTRLTECYRCGAEANE